MWLDMVDIVSWRKWHGQNFLISFYASGIYILLIFGIKFTMRDRSPFQLRIILTIWNFGLAMFSMFALYLMLPEYLNAVLNNGLHSSICERQNENIVYGVGLLLMAWSKLVELGDTLFVALRKQKLIFLHWYHHITVLIYIWAVFENNDPSLPLFMVINVFIHSIMYSYYSLKAMGIRVPTNISMVITVLQLIQMVLGVCVNIYSIFANANLSEQNHECDRSEGEIYGALAMYSSYLLLFANFFYQKYVISKPKPISKKE